MITDLHITNYALIESLDITFGSGLNIITGETGAGKSIVLGALSLVMGERADARAIRTGQHKAVIEARFDVSDALGFEKWLTDNDIDTFDGICIMRREITARGTSRAFINDTPVNLSMMRAASSMLLDIHNQHQNMLLTDSEYQLHVLDTVAENAELRKLYADAFGRYRTALKDYAALRDRLARAKSESEYNAYLLEQLDQLDLKEGEAEQLEHDRDVTANAAEIKSHLSLALDALDRDDNSTLDTLAKAQDELERISSYINDYESISSRLETARIEIADIAATLSHYDSSLTASPADLDEMERRLGQIYSLMKRHGVSTGAELIAVRKNLKDSLSAVENGDEQLAELEEKARECKKEVVMLARQLTKTRTDAAATLADALTQRAMPMGLPNLRCEIRVTSRKAGETGADIIDFLFAFNKNQAPMPVGKTASGGEISRIILALKSLLVEKMKLPTIILDEVDTGVSGDVANRMADVMRHIAQSTQVITITHIAAVAAHGDRHFKVYKRDDSDSTSTFVKALDMKERQAELALMISGNADDEKAIATACELLKHKTN